MNALSIQEVKTISARLLSAAVVSVGITTAALAQAGPPPQTTAMEWLAVGGVFAGTLYRSGRWWPREKGFKLQADLFRDDITGIVALCVITLGLCEWQNIHNFTAGLVGVAFALIGLEPLIAMSKAAAELFVRFKFGGKSE